MNEFIKLIAIEAEEKNMDIHYAVKRNQKAEVGSKQKKLADRFHLLCMSLHRKRKYVYVFVCVDVILGNLRNSIILLLFIEHKIKDRYQSNYKKQA